MTFALISQSLITDNSRATPEILKQSPRFGVNDSSMTWSSNERISCRSSPRPRSLGNSIKPSDSSARPNSLAEHSMPSEVIPFKSLGLIVIFPGNTAPTGAKATESPTRTLSAPQTITRLCSDPVLTWHIFNLSASGCFSTASTLAVTTPEKPGDADVSSSTSRPTMVNCSANC